MDSEEEYVEQEENNVLEEEQWLDERDDADAALSKNTEIKRLREYV